MKEVFAYAFLGSVIGICAARIIIRYRRATRVDSAVDVAIVLRHARTQLLRDGMVLAILERAVLRQMDAQLADIPVDKIADCYEIDGGS